MRWNWASAAALLALGCGVDSTEVPEQGAATEQPSAPSYDFSEVEQAIAQFVASTGEVDGVGALIVHRDHGVVYRKAFGAFDEDRVYLVASSSKIISAGVLVGLQDQGLLDLEAPIGDYLGWGEAKADRRVAQMLSNSAGMVGLDNPVYGPYLCQYVNQGSLGECARDIFDADDQEDLFEPDTRFRYGGGQWQLAGGIAEAISGKSWAELIRERYVEPCGMDSLGYENPYLRGGGVEIRYPEDFAIAGPVATDNPSIEGGAYINIDDYGKLLLMHLRGGECDNGRALSEAGVLQMRADRVADAYDGETSNPSLAGYGLGWWVDRDNEGMFVDGGAYGAMPWIDVNRGYGVFLALEAGNRFGGMLRAATSGLVDAAFDAAQ